MKKMKLYFSMIMIMSVTLMLTACHKENKNTNPNPSDTTIVTVTKQAQTIDLYYKGTIAPISNFSIMSPVSGRIESLGFTYGDSIVKNQLIATISADDLADTYQKQLSDYISKKDAMETSGNDYTSTVALFKAGVKTQNDVTIAQSSFHNSILAFNSSKHVLIKTAELLSIDFKSVESLSLKDVNLVTEELNKQFKNISVFSRYNGVALHPLNTSNSNDTDSSIAVGSDVKENQLLLSVGDLKGFSTQFNVNELDIHHFSVGQKILVTGDAFPGITLQGKISEVASQANTNFGSQGMAQFTVAATLPDVSPEIASKIDIGMSAKIDVPILTKPEISIPITALSIQNGQTVVQKLDQNNQIITVPVTVGTTMIASATITSGLQAGDRIVVPNH
jgi:HlyD family secretion protein